MFQSTDAFEAVNDLFSCWIIWPKYISVNYTWSKTKDLILLLHLCWFHLVKKLNGSLIVFLSVSIWYNPWCHVSKQDDLQQKYRPTTSEIQQYISLYTWGTFYPCVHHCVFGWSRIIFLETLPNNMWWFFAILCYSPAVVLGESLATQTLLVTVH